MNYSLTAKKVLNAIKKNGSKCYITHLTDRTYDKTTNTYTGTETTVNGYALLNNYDMKNIDGVTIKAGDVSLMCVLDSTPVVGDKITFGSKTYTVVTYSAVNPDGNTVLYYQIQAR